MDGNARCPPSGWHECDHVTVQMPKVTNSQPVSPMWSIPLSHGFSVFPLWSGTKHPACRWKEYKERRATPEEILEWERGNFNVGIVTGHASGVVVLDLDSEDALREAERRGLPHTVQVITPRGRHAYFRHPGGTVSNATRLFEGADVRGDGGYVVAPGSEYRPTAAERRDGKLAGKYRWLNSPDTTEIAECPAWLVEAVHKKAGADTNLVRDAAMAAPIGCAASLQELVDCVRSAQVGCRNDELNRCAFIAGGWIQEGRISAREAADSLRAAALAAGLDLAEIEPTLASGLNAGKEKALTDGTEDGVANLFATDNEDSFRFDHHRGTWFRWTSSHWAVDDKQVALHLIREIARRLGGGRKALRRASAARGAEALARCDPRMAVISTDWDKDPLLLGTPAGTVDLRSGQLRPPTPSDGITKVTSVAPSDAQPERWLQFLREATGDDEEFIAFLQRMCGYLLTGDTREQVLFFLYGGGGNGKSVFLNTPQAVMNDYAVAAPMDAFTVSRFHRHPTELAMMNGARLVAASETAQENTWDEPKLKQLTGGDPITARFMRQDFFTFTPGFKLLIVGNHRPRLQNVDDATRRRFRILPFDRTPSKPDPRLPRKLEAEYPAILQWMIEGCSKWQREGLGSAQAIDLATQGYFEEQDVISQWVREECATGSDLRCEPKELFESWTNYCNSRALKPGSMLSFGETLVKRGYLRSKSNGVRYHEGIRAVPFRDLSASRDAS